jgi:hypothetical protein
MNEYGWPFSSQTNTKYSREGNIIKILILPSFYHFLLIYPEDGPIMG